MGVIPFTLASVLSLAPLFGYASESTPKKPVVHVCKKTDTPVDSLACNIWQEGRGENISGYMAVGFVTINRLKNRSYPQTISKIVYQKSQFTWYNPGYNYRIRDEDSWKVAKDVAKFLYSVKDNDRLYKQLDITHGATHFHTKTTKPYWSNSLKKTATIGKHVFYKLKAS